MNKNKYIIIILIFSSVLFCINSRARPKQYKDVQKFMLKMLGSMDTFIRCIEKTEDSKEAVKIIKIYTRELKRQIPKLKRLEKKYPELNIDENCPYELKKIMLNMEDAYGTKGLISAFKNLEKFKKDSEVKKASLKLEGLFHQ